MIHISREIRSRVEDDLSPHRFHSVAECVYASLELTVGRRLAAQMSEQQVGVSGVLVDNQDSDGALADLQANFPQYQALVHESLREHLALVAAAHHIGLLVL